MYSYVYYILDGKTNASQKSMSTKIINMCLYSSKCRSTLHCRSATRTYKYVIFQDVIAEDRKCIIVTNQGFLMFRSTGVI